MHQVAAQYFGLSEDQKRQIQVLLCRWAYEAWCDYVNEFGPLTYRESVTGTIQNVDVGLPSEAIEAVVNGTDDGSVDQRYREPVVAMQDDDLSWSDDIDLAYYAIYNLYRFHVVGMQDDSWLVVNQALSALGEERAIENLRTAIEHVA